MQMPLLVMHRAIISHKLKAPMIINAKKNEECDH